ncbi:MAG: hypothetical protein EAZ95_06295 [Bacteroidetes bacterium]|nr:MAG: hypothetical protein EAZ95_06295 [Bacteroidota bacterium]
MNDIQLTFINESNDRNNSSVVVFQRNVATNFDEIAVAWKVIKNCGTGWQHPFTFPMEFQVGARDAWGNSIIKPTSARNGQAFKVWRGSSGDELLSDGEATSRKEVQVLNALPNGSIDATIYKDGKLLALKTGISPEQKAVFEFKPTIWIGVASQINEGTIMNSAIISNFNTELGLLGVASADIVMRGGGTGPGASAFTFSMENICYV